MGGPPANTIDYKGYNGSVEFSGEDRVFHGRVVGIRDTVTFEGVSVDDLEVNFRNAVDEYLRFCESEGKRPDTPFKGTFQVRVSRELHKKAAMRAQERHVKLGKVVTEALEKFLVEA